MEEDFNLDEVKKILGLVDYPIGYEYELYKSYFPEMDYNRFCILDKNGMKGRLWRGLPIDLTRENIHIPFCWWRNAIYKATGQPVPYFPNPNNTINQ